MQGSLSKTRRHQTRFLFFFSICLLLGLFSFKIISLLITAGWWTCRLVSRPHFLLSFDGYLKQAHFIFSSTSSSLYILCSLEGYFCRGPFLWLLCLSVHFPPHLVCLAVSLIYEGIVQFDVSTPSYMKTHKAIMSIETFPKVQRQRINSDILYEVNFT